MNNKRDEEKKKKIKIAIFDFDGVIVNSNSIKKRAFFDIYRKYSTATYKQMLKYEKSNFSLSRYAKFEYLLKTLLEQENYDTEIKKIDLILSSTLINKISRANFIPGFLQFVKKIHKKIPIYIVSNTPTKEVELISSNKKINHFFKNIYGSPTPKEYWVNKIIKKHKVKRNQVLYFGDSPSDLQLTIKTAINFFAINYNSPNKKNIPNNNKSRDFTTKKINNLFKII